MRRIRRGIEIAALAGGPVHIAATGAADMHVWIAMCGLRVSRPIADAGSLTGPRCRECQSVDGAQYAGVLR